MTPVPDEMETGQEILAILRNKFQGAFSNHCNT